MVGARGSSRKESRTLVRWFGHYTEVILAGVCALGVSSRRQKFCDRLYKVFDVNGVPITALVTRWLFASRWSEKASFDSTPSQPCVWESFIEVEVSMAATGSDSWLEWTNLEAKTTTVGHKYRELLFSAEEVIAEGRGVVLVNLDVAGTLLVTNFRLMFVSENQNRLIMLGTIPLATIEKFCKLVSKPTLQGPRTSMVSRVRDRGPTLRLLQVVGKDMRNIVYGFRPRTKQRRAVFEALTTKLLKPARLWELFAFDSHLPPASTSGCTQMRLHEEYLRMLSTGAGLGSVRGSSNLGSISKSLEADKRGWRVSEVNIGYAMSPTYPSRVVVPASISDEEVLQAAGFRARGRLPVLSWRHGGNGAVLARSSQPLIGIMMNSRSNTDEKLVAALCPPMINGLTQSRKLYIADARPRKNALANGALGGGSESSANYLNSEVVFLGIDNIHVMRDSFGRLRDYLDLHGGASSDGSSSLMRSGGWAWGGSSRSSMSAAVSALGDSGWLMHVHSILSSAAWIAGRLVLEGASVLIHCSDGWDRTTQLISLAQLMLDPYYRTFRGFQALIEKDWLAFGHPFADRLGIATFIGGSMYQTEAPSQPLGEVSPPVKGGHASSYSSPMGIHSPGGISNNYSPVFLQWADCVAQLLRLYPRAFEYSSLYLVDLVDAVLSCRFGNFLCNNERERVLAGISDSTPDLWSYFEKERLSGRAKHEHYNILYDDSDNCGALLPPAAALAPILWPQFCLRWACPSDLDMGGLMPTGLGHGGDLENEARMWASSVSFLQKSKDKAEQLLEESSVARRTLEEQLLNEKRHRSSAMSVVGRAQQENAALKRVLEAMGCKIRISKSKSAIYCEGEVSYDGHFDSSEEGLETQLHGQDEDDDEDSAQQLAVSVSLEGDSAAYRLRKAYGAEHTLNCSSQASGDACKWPQTRCARLGSACLGLKADFEALEQLSVLDKYFDPDHKDPGPSSSSGRANVPQET